MVNNSGQEPIYDGSLFFLEVSQGSSGTNHIDRSNVHVSFGLSFLESHQNSNTGLHPDDLI